jgi:hypothetical protein
MKRTLYFILWITLLAAFTLSGCSHNKPIENKQDGYQLATNSKTTFTVLNLPAWVAFSPSGETAIGIAPVTGSKKNDSTELTKKFAALSLAKNHGSFIVDKSALIKLSEKNEKEMKPADFEAIEKGESVTLYQQNDDLSLLSQTDCKGYKLCLYSLEKQTVNNDLIRVSADRTPDWCKNGETTEDQEFVYVIGYGENTDLVEAWQSAQDEALKNLVHYRLLHILPKLKAAVDTDSKMQIIDKIPSDAGASFAKTWFFHKQVNTESSFNVFIMLKASK